jgi:hypothetical protein
MQDQNKDRWIAIVRTIAPMIWSFVLVQSTPVISFIGGLLTSAGYSLEQPQINALNQAAVALIAAFIYTVVTWASARLPFLQWVLLIPVQPKYEEGKK